MNTKAAPPIQSTGLRERLRIVAEFLVVGICTLAFALTFAGILGSLLARNAAGSHDFVEYWAAGHLLAHHANPYDGDAILHLERTTGFPAGIPPLIMANTPWSLPLVLPLSWLSPKTGLLLWTLLLFFCLVASVRMVGAMHGRRKTRLNILGYAFAPALICLLVGQISIFLLLGLVLFLRLHQLRPFWAGASLWLCMLKPHMFLPFGIVLLLWAMAMKSYKVLAGAASALAISTAIVLIIDPHVWLQYVEMMNTSRVDRIIFPCLSVMLRVYVWPHTFWLQCVPAALGCAWAIGYFRRHRLHWDWLKHGSLLMLVSVLVPPYTWFTDQAILIPALLHAAYVTHSRIAVALLALASAAVEMQNLLGASSLYSALYLWTVPVWLVWYLFATKPDGAAKGSAPAVTAAAALIPAGGSDCPK